MSYAEWLRALAARIDEGHGPIYLCHIVDAEKFRDADWRKENRQLRAEFVDGYPQHAKALLGAIDALGDVNTEHLGITEYLESVFGRETDRRLRVLWLLSLACH